MDARRLLPGSLLWWVLAGSITGCERELPAPSPLPGHPERDRHYQQGNAHLQAGRFQEATGAYSAAIALDSLYAPAYCYLGNAYVGLWRWEDAITAYRTAIRLDSTFLPSYHNLAAAYGEQGRYPEALEQLDRALRIDPGAAESHRFAAFFHQQQGEYARAEEALIRAIRADSTDVRSHQALGNFMRMLGRRQKAEAAFRRALEADGRDVESLRELGLVLTGTGHYREAEELFRRALDIRPGHEKLHHNLANLLAIQGRSVEAKSLLAEFERLSHHVDLAERLQRTISRGEGDAEIYLQLAASYSELGQTDEALEAFDALLQRQPGQVQALAGSSRLLLHLGKLEEAVARARRAVSAFPEAAVASRAWYVIGFAGAREGRLEDAAEAFARAASLDSSFADAHVGLGNVLAMQGRLAAAGAAYRAALRHAPDLTGARYGLATCLERAGKLDEATEVLERLVESRPTFAQGHLALARARDRNGDLQAALGAYRAFVANASPGDERLGEARARIEQLDSR